MPAYRNMTFGVQTQSVTSGAPTSATVTMSPSPDNGDLVVVVLAIRNTGGAVPAITAPAGYTLVAAVGGGAGNTAHVAVYRHRWLTGDPTAPQWTFAAVSGFCTTAVAFAGVDASTPEDVAAATYDSGGVAGTTLTATATSATAWAPYLACWVVYNQNPIPGGDGVRLVHAYGNADLLSVAEGRRPVAGAYTATATSISAASRVGVLLTLRPADAGAVSPARDFYVRPDGADGNSGLAAGAGTAWATLLRALDLPTAVAAVGAGSTLLSGDRLYIAPGTYRETIAAGFVSLSSAAPVQVIGDPAAERFTDLQGGEVVWSAFTTDDATTGFTDPPLDLNGRSYVVLDRLALYGGQETTTGNALGGDTGGTSQGVTVRRCLLYGGRAGSNAASLTPPEGNSAWTFDRCVVVAGAAGSGILVTLPRSSTAEYDCGLLVENCLFLGGAGASASTGAGVEYTASGALTFRGGGGVVRHCTFLLCANGVKAGVSGVSVTLPPVTYRNAFYGCGAGAMSAGSAVQLQVLEDYNLVEAGTVAQSNVLAGAATAVAANLDLAVGHGPLFGRRARPLGEPGPTSQARRYTSVLLAVRPPGTAADQGGGNAAWTNPGNATNSDDAYAVSAAIAATTGVTNALRVTNFGFAVPSGATIVGVRADVEAIASGASSVGLSRLQLVLSGSAIGTAKANSISKLSTTQSVYYSLGGGTDLWGATPSRADVNDATFGVEAVFNNVNAATRTCSVDLIRLTVFYTLATAEPTVDLYDRPRPGPYGVASACGALERGDVAVRDALTYHTAAPSARVDGFGWQDWQFHVSAVPTTISCYLRKSSVYAGDQPRLQLLADGEIGVAAAETAMAGGADAWEQVSVTFTPTRAGLATVRVLAPSTAGSGATGAVWVDDFALA